MARRLARSVAAAVVLGSLFCLLGGAPAAAAPKVVYARLTIPQEGGPAAVAYVSVSNNKLRVAATIKELASAEPVTAKQSTLEPGGWGNYFQSYTFPETSLPVSVSGYSRASVSLNYYRSGARARKGRRAQEHITVYGDLTLSRKDSNGVTWGYVLSLRGPHSENPTYTSERPYELTAPQLSSQPLTFEIVTQVEGHKARIGMQIKSAKTDVNNLLKEGKGTPVRLEVVDKKGAKVVSETGDPLKFGFT